MVTSELTSSKSRLNNACVASSVLPRCARYSAKSSGALTLVGLVALTIPAWGMLLMAPGYPLPALTALFALAIPAAYLWTNPQLEPID